MVKPRAKRVERSLKWMGFHLFSPGFEGILWRLCSCGMDVNEEAAPEPDARDLTLAEEFKEVRCSPTPVFRPYRALGRSETHRNQ